jgi:hypothetical protein
VIEFAVPVDCLDEPCNSEGLDNSILGWSTDYFIAFVMFGMSLHLWWFSSLQIHCSAIVSILSMGVAYVLGGLGHSIFANSGYDDNTGQQGFYIIWAVGFTFMTLSVTGSYLFVRQVSSTCNTISQCMRNFLTVTFILVLGAWMATAGGYVWCATEDDLHVDQLIDDVSPIGVDSGGVSDVEQCLQMAAISELIWYTSFALFWIPAGRILRLTVLETQLMEKAGERLTVYGFRAAWAALWVSIIPWTFGVMLIVYSLIAAVATGQEAIQVYEDIYGAVIYHYGMLIGYFLFHNLAYSLPRYEKKTRWVDDSIASKE